MCNAAAKPKLTPLTGQANMCNTAVVSCEM